MDFKHSSCSDDDPREWIIPMPVQIKLLSELIFSHIFDIYFLKSINQIMQAVLEELESVSLT